MSSISAALLAFGVILLVELPDKTLAASLVLSTRYRPRPVLLGVAAAFAVQSVIAAAAGGVITLLPRRGVEGVVALMFAIGAILLIKESLDAANDDVELAEARENAPFWRIVLTSFGVLFAAEWGDASQIATAGLVARHSGVGHAIATGAGAWVALVVVAAVAVVAGKLVVQKVPLHLVHRVAGVAVRDLRGGRRDCCHPRLSTMSSVLAWELHNLCILSGARFTTCLLAVGVCTLPA